MSIIEEMREKARDLQGVGEYWLAEHLEAWADRLAASAELRAENERLDRKRMENILFARLYLKKAHEANATLAALRLVVPEGDARSWSMLDAAYDILYPKETTE